MHPSDEMRSTLALRQAALVGALVSRDEPPPGFDAARLRVAAASLVRKRAGSIARIWPELVASEGQSFQTDFDNYARSTPSPRVGGPLADGYAFSRWLTARGRLPEAGRLRALAVELRYKRVATGLVRRSGPAVRLAWFGQSRRWIVAIRLPWIGEKWIGARGHSTMKNNTPGV